MRMLLSLYLVLAGLASVDVHGGTLQPPIVNCVAELEGRRLAPPTQVITDEQAIQLVLALKKARLDVSMDGMIVDSHAPQFAAILASVTGRQTEPAAFLAGLKRQYSTGWGRILRLAATPAPTQVRQARPILSAETIKALIADFSREGLNVNTRALRKPDQKSDPEYLRLTEKRTGYAFAKGTVYTRAMSLHRDWNWWLEQSGVDPDLGRRRVARISPSLIIQAIQGLKAAGYRIGEASMRGINNSPEAREVIFSVTGRRILPSKIYNDAVRDGKKWRTWLKEAGVNYNSFDRPQMTIDAETILQVIQALSAAGFKVDMMSMIKNTANPEVSNLVKTVCKKEMTSAQVFFQAIRVHQRPWDDWLMRSGFDPVVIRGESPHRGGPQFSKEQIILLIQKLVDMNYPVNYEAFSENWNASEASRALIVEVTGKDVLPATILQNATVRWHLPWDWWLVQAGLNPLEIRRRSGASYRFLTAAMKREFAANYNAVHGLQRAKEDLRAGSGLVVAVEAEQENAVDSQKVNEAMATAQEQMDDGEAQLMDLMLDYFAYHEDFDVGALARYASERSDGPVTPEQIAKLFQRMSRNPQLRALAKTD